MLPSRNHDRGVHDIVRARPAATRPGKLGHLEIERLDDRSIGGDKTGDPNLSSSVSPYLADHAGWHDDGGAVHRCDLAEGQHLPVALLDRYQRSRIEDYGVRS
jgi:hypothetical protein